MKELLIFLLLSGFGSAFVTTSQNVLEKCDIVDTIGILGCVEPVLGLLDNQINLSNATRAMGIRITDECRNATKCVSQFSCATKAKLDKVMDLLCDAFDYFSTKFAPCQAKIVKMNPPCLRNIKKNLMGYSNKVKNPCDVLEKSMTCAESEIVQICGADYWLPIKNFYQRIESYNIVKCKKTITELDS